MPVTRAGEPHGPPTSMDFSHISQIARALDDDKRPETRRVYACAWRRFETWCEANGYEALPADPWNVPAYLCHRAEAAALAWDDVQFLPDGTGRVVVRRSKTSREATVQPLRRTAVEVLRAIRPPDAGGSDPVFGLAVVSIGRVIGEACRRAGLGDGFTSHSPRVGMAQDLAAAGFALPEIMQAGRWRSVEMVARYTERLAADRSAVARLPEHLD